MKIKVFVLTIFCLCSLFQKQGSAFSNYGEFEVGAEWLYWQDFQDNMAYATEVQQITGEHLTINSKALSPPFKLSNGCRVFACYTPNEKPWTINAQLTHFSTQNSKNTGINLENFNADFIVLNANSFPIFTLFDQFQIHFANLDSQWSSNLNYADIDFIYPFYPRLGCVLSPHFGLRGSWMKQSLNLQGFSPQGDEDGFHITSRFKEKYWGIGVEGGLNASFNLGCGFSIVGAINGALLYARIGMTQVLEFDISDFTTVNVDETIKHLTPWVDGFIGINYEGCMGCFLFNLHAGWEQHVLMNANLFPLFSSNYNLQGLTLGGSLLF